MAAQGIRRPAGAARTFRTMSRTNEPLDAAAPSHNRPSASIATWVDGHLDLAMLGVNGRDLRQPLPPGAEQCVSFPALAAGGVRVALGTIFTELGGDPAVEKVAYRDEGDLEGAHRAGLVQLAWYEAMEAAGAIAIVRTRGDLERALRGEGPLGVVILMECADPIRSPDEAAWWHARGLRVVGLSWARGSRYAGGNARAGGLAPIGRRMVEALDALGILHDASHLSRAAFDDLLSATGRRVIATHSNAAALLPENERHLTDAQMQAIAARDGWIGLNLYGRFLADGRRATLADCVNHVMHAARIVGAHRVGMGSDLDGGFGCAQLPEEIQSPTQYARLLPALADAGFAALPGAARDALGGFAHANLARILRETLPAGPE
jgi:membrane dipeptidase